MGLFSKWKGTALGALAAPFTGGLSLAAGYLYDANNQQNAKNKKAIAEANAYDMYTWDLANQYNDPKAQMERLKAAGLNPNLVYGSGNVTGNTTGTANSNGVATQTAFNAIEKGLPVAQAVANLRNTNSQNELLKYQQGQTEAQTAFARAKTRDLNNFLDGKGPSTYALRYQGTSTQEPSADPEIEDVVSEVLGGSAGATVRRIKKTVEKYPVLNKWYNTLKKYDFLNPVFGPRNLYRFFNK